MYNQKGLYILDLNHVCAVARFEIKLISRSKSIKLLSMFSIFFVLFFIIWSHYVYYSYTFLPGALAVKAFFWLSILKILFSPFIAPVFIKENQLTDSFKALYPRPFSNMSYILGKMLGFTLVMLIIDYFFMSAFFVSDIILGKHTMSLWPYLLYPLIITMPLSFFVFGMNTFLGYIKYPLVFVGTYILLIVFLPFKDIESVRHLDLAAITLPLAYSTFTGFYNFSQIIIQRMIYICGGLGLVMCAVIVSQFSRRSISMKMNLVSL